MANTKVTGDLIASSTIATGNIADNAVTSDKISGITTAHITEGSNLYYTDARADARVALLVDSAPTTLDTLNELAAALGDDPNFATTTATSIGLKAPLASPSFTGNVGIGADSPDNSLHILYNDSTVYSDSLHNAGIQIENENTTTSTFSQLHFRSGGSDSYIRNIRGGSNLASLAFLTDNGGTSGDVGEAMRIDSSGNVGIGNTSPDAFLHIGGAPAISAEALIARGNASGQYAVSIEQDNSGGFGLIIDTDSTDSSDPALKVQNPNGSLLDVRSNGNIGIGTTSPDSPLEIQNVPAQGSKKMMLHLDANHTGNQGSAFLRISAGSSSGANTKIETVSSGGQGLFGTYTDTNIINSGTSTGAYGNINFITGSSTSASSIVMTIGGGSQKGNVGIGTTSPSEKLEVSGGNIRIENSSTQICSLSFSEDNTNKNIIMEYDGTGSGAGNYFSFYSNVNGWMTKGSSLNIQPSTGNVGIGTTDPDAKLDVSSVSNAIIRITSTGNGLGANTKIGSLEYYGNDASVPGAGVKASIRAITEASLGDDAALVFSNSNGVTNDIERMRITSGGIVKINSEKIVGTGNGIFLGGARLNAVTNAGATADNSSYLGYSSGRWIAVYAVSGTIQTSDVREKTEIKSTQLGLDFVNDLNPVSYRWIDGKRQSGEKTIKDKRQHQGLIAQEVAETLEKHGVNKNEFGGLDIQKTDKYDDFHGMSYEQLVAPMVKAIQELKAEVDLLKTKINN